MGCPDSSLAVVCPQDASTLGVGGVHYSNLGSVQEGMHGKWKVRDSRGHGREVAKAVVLVTDLHSY